MRLWSIHPKHLDTPGLVALWREGLGAKKAIEYFARGEKCGYQHHPQLQRFYAQQDKGLAAINTFLYYVLVEAKRRSYNFNSEKIDMSLVNKRIKIKVKDGQVKYESQHLNNKLEKRSPSFVLDNVVVKVHPMFRVVSGIGIEDWEKVGTTNE